jgi:carbon storage regulator
MLVLTRRLGEKVVIAGNVHITIVALQGDKVRIGVQAPKSVRVDRGEVHARRQASAAAEPPPSSLISTLDGLAGAQQRLAGEGGRPPAPENAFRGP